LKECSEILSTIMQRDIKRDAGIEKEKPIKKSNYFLI
jgi:hypothetical protein